MDYQTLLNNFDELNGQIALAKKEMQEKSTGLIEQATKIFLDACPEVTGIHWTQYTPYFNDGESCEFSVNDICFHILEDEDDEIEAYESTTLFTLEDLKTAEEKLEDVKAYVADPDAWRANYYREYRERWGREYNGNPQYLYPYPRTVEDAQERIDRIKESLEKYNDEVASRIEKEFANLTAALKKIPEDIMQAIYGDHVLVVINRDGTDIDEYNHE